MKTTTFFNFTLLALLTGFLVFTSCKKDEAAIDYNSDKSQLTKTIDSLTQIYNIAVEGNKPGNYAEGSKASLKATLDLATGKCICNPHYFRNSNFECEICHETCSQCINSFNDGCTLCYDGAEL